jgi:acetyl esterase
MAASEMFLPGRLGDPSMNLTTEPRLHPQILEALPLLGGGALSPPPPVTSDTPLDEVLQYIGQVDAGTQALYDVSFTAFKCPASSQHLTGKERRTACSENILYVARVITLILILPRPYHLIGQATRRSRSMNPQK